MKNYIVYEDLGKILKVGYCPDIDFTLQVQGTEKIIEGIANPSTQYIDNNTVVDMPEKPQGEYRFNYSTKSWEFDRETAEKNAISKRNQLLKDGPDRISPMWWASMTEQEQQAWTFYRQALLDITSQSDYPEFIVWPIKP